VSASAAQFTLNPVQGKLADGSSTHPQAR
jgi:hypothetical protein